ncbi:MAG: hypothetical protein E6Q98_18005 [Rhodospirillaceae bacterium]|nr:MAG: hypothetical protein E6Q98_18005 [Rhodospirillaceae bacterium]
MKTADVELGSRKNASRKLTSFLGLERLVGRKKQSRFKGGPAAAGGGEKTRTSQSIPDVLAILQRDGAQRVAVYGDANFFQTFSSQAPGRDCVWLSNDFLADQPNGARPITPEALSDRDAVVVGGRDAATNFRLVLREMHQFAPSKPVHWVAENWEFCGGTLAVPAEIDDVDALVFNHFEEFFGIKDPLQFRFEVIAEDEVKRRYLILGPNESINLNLNDLAGTRHGAICLKIWITHPTLTRGRHYRFRPCADVFWKDSFTIVHGSHQFFKSPNKTQEFRLIDSVLRRGHVVMTVPNYDLDMGSDDAVVVELGNERTRQTRQRKRPVEEVHFPYLDRASTERHYYAASYRGYGTSFWYAMEEGFSDRPGKIASLSGNHLCKVGVDNRGDTAFKPEERQLVEAAVKAGFMIQPCCLPVLRGAQKLSFGFNFDASNPPFEDYWLRFYDAAGQCVGDLRYHKGFIGPAFIEDVLAEAPEAARERAVMALVTPDHLKIDLAPQRLVTTADLIVRHLETGDQDATEFQSSWRNLGTQVPTLPHWLHPSIAVIGRSNLIGRVRCRDGYRTGVFIANASGNLNYRMRARCEVAVINHTGHRLSHFLTLPAFGAEITWLDDVLPTLQAHLGESGVGTLQVKSADADVTAHVLGLSPQGAVGLQHLWGY